MTADARSDVVVVGAGISGLTAARLLRRHGYRVTVLERQVRIGGNAISERIDGFLMEHGPSSVNAMLPAAPALSRALGLASEECGLTAAVRHRYLVKDGRLRAIPLHPAGLFVSSYLSWRGRLRSLAEILVPPASPEAGEETVAAFWRRRFGPEFEQGVIDPLVGGLFAGCSHQLSMPATFPRIVELERRHGSVTRAMMARRRAGSAMPGRRLFSWRDGVASLPRALAAELGDAVRTGVAVRRIGRTARGFRLELGDRGTVRARALVLATQPHVAGALLEGLDEPASTALLAIPAPPLAVVFTGFPRRRVAHPLDGVGCLAASRERRPVNGILFCSSMFPHRAPQGAVALAAYIGGARAPDLARLPEAELVAIARRELADLLGAEGEPQVVRVRRWPRGLPQYLPGHAGRVERIATLDERQPGLFVTGNFLNGLSVGCCVAQAEATALRVATYLAREEAGSSGRPAVARFR